MALEIVSRINQFGPPKRRPINPLLATLSLASTLLLLLVVSALLKSVGATNARLAQRTAPNLRPEREATAAGPAQISKSAGDKANSLAKRSQFNFDDSAEFPAEFRGESELKIAPEQQAANDTGEQPSRLAKLCQQTSSVLASVLPAPFGGHKRSILCQFFGAVPIVSQANGDTKRLINSNTRPARFSGQTHESVAILHHARNSAPMTLIRPNGRHPIQMVLDHHLLAQQQQLLNQHHRQKQQLTISQLTNRNIVTQHNQDLKESGSVIDYSYQQRVQPPQTPTKKHSDKERPGPKGHKFSAPVSSTSFRPVSVHQVSTDQMSTSGWRIFNQSLVQQLEAANQTGSSPVRQQLVSSSTSASTNGLVEGKQTAEPTNSTIVSPISPKETYTNKQVTISNAGISPSANNATSDKTIAAKPTSVPTTPSSSTTTMPAASPTSIITQSTTSLPLVTKKNDLPYTSVNPIARIPVGSMNISDADIMPSNETNSGIRTIEVNAQNPDTSNWRHALVSLVNTTSGSGFLDKTSNVTTVGKSPVPVTNILQPREELVIANINNLTRIAFGNQLRDTVRVINKLIEQQSGLFKQLDSGSSKPARDLVPRENKTSTTSTPSPLTTRKTKSMSLTISKLRPLQVQSSSSSISTPPTRPSLLPVSSSTSKIRKISPETGLSDSTAKTYLKSTSRSFKRSSQPLISSAATTRMASNKLTRLQAAPRSTTISLPIKQRGFGMLLPEFHSDGDLDSHPATLIEDIIRQDPKDSSSTSLASGPDALYSGTRHILNANRFSVTLPDPVTVHPNWLRHSPPNKFSRFNANIENRTKKSDYNQANRITSSTSKRSIQSTYASDKQAPSLSKLSDPNSKQRVKLQQQDSLTTLKLSLTTSQPLLIATAASSARPSSLQPTTMTSDKATQSRWVATTNSFASTSPTTARPETSRVGSLSESELNELRASDSISKFTTSHQRISSAAPNPTSEMVTIRRVSSPPQIASTSSVAHYGSTNGLNQLASTGEFFDAETISLWPERRHQMTMQSSISPPTSNTGRNMPMYELTDTTQPISWRDKLTTIQPSEKPNYQDVFVAETTRRNGEFYGSDISATTRNQPTTSSMSNQPEYPLILPQNHKLSTSAAEAYPTSPGPDSNQAESLNNSSPTHSTQPPTRATQQTSYGYTLVGPITDVTETLETKSTDENNSAEQATSHSFPQIALTNSYKQSGPNNSSLRPPYSEGHHMTKLVFDDLEDAETEDIDEDSLAIQHQAQHELINKPLAGRKLYELILPSSRNFVGSQSPMNQQRFNLSALKYLAQNLLSLGEPTSRANATIATDNSTIPIIEDQLSPNYYEYILSSNNSNSKTVEATNKAVKSLSSRASNLLKELKQLEQKRAAALMAAIRYQVPGPLVRPWDYASELMLGTNAASLARDPNRRHDRGSLYPIVWSDDGHWLQPSGRISSSRATGLLSSLLGNSGGILGKQRFVARNELEARLSGTGKNSAHRGADRDSTDLTSQIRRPLPADLGQLAISVLASAADGNDVNSGFGTRENLTSSSGGAIERRSHEPEVAESETVRSSMRRPDYDLIDLFAPANRSSQAAKTNNNNDYDQSNHDRKSANVDQSEMISSGSSIIKSQGSAMQKKLANSIHLHGAKENSATETIPSKAELERVGGEAGDGAVGSNRREDKFDCSNKSSGFYPDIASNCQTFFHCSSSGHLLTFSCPQASRFDENSLKCGAWFEVPCDPGRFNRSRPYSN